MAEIGKNQVDWQERSVQDGLMIKDPICLAEDNTVGDALLIMDSIQVNHIPITENGESHGRLIGIISSRDVAQTLSNDLSSASKPIKSCMTDLRYNFSVPELREMWHVLTLASTWKEAMTFLTTPVSIHIPNKYINFLISAVTVIDEKDSHLVGLVSYIDLIKRMSKQEVTLKIPVQTLSVGAVMNKDLEKIDCVKPDDSFSDVVNILVEKRHRRTIPVIFGTKIIGIIRDKTVFAVRNDLVSSGEFKIKANDPRIMEDARFIKFITPEQKIIDIIDDFLDKSSHPDAIIVVEDVQEKNIKGILSYVDIFKALLNLNFQTPKGNVK